MRRYRLAGLHAAPPMLLWGAVPRAALPVVERVREGSPGDVDLMDSVDRQVRGAAHGVDHEAAGRDPTGSSWRTGRPARATPTSRPGGGPTCWRPPTGAPPTDLLWEALAATSPDAPVEVAHVTAANEWAVDVGMACRMQLWTRGYLALRGHEAADAVPAQRPLPLSAVAGPRGKMSA